MALTLSARQGNDVMLLGEAISGKASAVESVHQYSISYLT